MSTAPFIAGLVLIAIGFTAIAIALGSRQDTRNAAPFATAAAPDVYLEDGVVTQFRNDGTLHYRLAASRMAHFEQRVREPATTRLASPTLTLHAPAVPPWRLTALAGEIGAEEATEGGDERVGLRGDVVLSQRHDDGRFTQLRTDAMTLHLGRESVHGEQPVIIATESSRGTAAGFRADLASGRFELHSSPSMRVSVAIEPPP